MRRSNLPEQEPPPGCFVQHLFSSSPSETFAWKSFQIKALKLRWNKTLWKLSSSKNNFIFWQKWLTWAPCSLSRSWRCAGRTWRRWSPPRCSTGQTWPPRSPGPEYKMRLCFICSSHYSYNEQFCEGSVALIDQGIQDLWTKLSEQIHSHIKKKRTCWVEIWVSTYYNLLLRNLDFILQFKDD